MLQFAFAAPFAALHEHSVVGSQSPIRHRRSDACFLGHRTNLHRTFPLLRHGAGARRKSNDRRHASLSLAGTTPRSTRSPYTHTATRTAPAPSPPTPKTPSSAPQTPAAWSR